MQSCGHQVIEFLFIQQIDIQIPQPPRMGHMLGKRGLEHRGLCVRIQPPKQRQNRPHLAQRDAVIMQKLGIEIRDHAAFVFARHGDIGLNDARGGVKNRVIRPHGHIRLGHIARQIRRECGVHLLGHGARGGLIRGQTVAQQPQRLVIAAQPTQRGQRDRSRLPAQGQQRQPRLCLVFVIEQHQITPRAGAFGQRQQAAQHRHRDQRIAQRTGRQVGHISAGGHGAFGQLAVCIDQQPFGPDLHQNAPGAAQILIKRIAQDQRLARHLSGICQPQFPGQFQAQSPAPVTLQNHDRLGPQHAHTPSCCCVSR